MSEYEINKQDVDAVINYLKIHDPKNADEEYAVQLLHSMNQTAKEMVGEDITFAQLVEKTLEKKN